MPVNNETHIQLSPDINPPPHIFDIIAQADINAITASFKSALLQHVFTVPTTPAPPGVAEALADRAVSGHFKYHDAETRELRDQFNAVVYADLPDLQPLQPLREQRLDVDRVLRFKRALVEAVTVYFGLVKEKAPLQSSLLVEWASRDIPKPTPTHASAYIVALVDFIFDASSGDVEKKIATVAKLVAGVPVTLTTSGDDWDWEWYGRHDADSEVKMLRELLVFSMIGTTINCERPSSFSSPGDRWRLAGLAKASLFVMSGAECNYVDVASRAVDIDYVHNVIEIGLALAHPVLGSAIVGPNSAANIILGEMAGADYKPHHREFQGYERDDGVFQNLVEHDRGIKAIILGMDVGEESMVSLVHYFPQGCLASFVDYGAQVYDNVTISKHGIVLYFPTAMGPWYDVSIGGGRDGRDPMKLVMRVDEKGRSAEVMLKTMEEKRERMRTNWLEESPVSEETKKRFKYILNKPGRCLVKRRGLRGRYGQILLTVVVICGIVVSVINFAGRDNWLEKVFDGAQAASLLAGLIIIIIFYFTGTITNTMDLLAGRTEAEDINQISLLTGLSMEKLQGVLTYARGTLYWLSEHRASYCRAIRLGDIVMTAVLKVDENEETRAGVRVTVPQGDDDGRAIWIMQGRSCTVVPTEAGDGSLRMVQAPISPQTIRALGSHSDGVELE